MPDSGSGDDDEIDESDQDSDSEVVRCMLWNMPNPFSCNESQNQAKKWVDKSIIKCPHANCSRDYAVGGTFRFNSDLLSTLY